MSGEDDTMIEKWLKKIEDRVQAAKDADQVFGACILPDPNGGPPMCVQLDEQTCQNLQGTFVGGDCT